MASSVRIGSWGNARRALSAIEQEFQPLLPRLHGAKQPLVDGSADHGIEDVEGYISPALSEAVRQGAEPIDAPDSLLDPGRVPDRIMVHDPATPGDHVQLAERQVEIDALEVVLARAAHADGGAGGDGRANRAPERRGPGNAVRTLRASFRGLPRQPSAGRDELEPLHCKVLIERECVHDSPLAHERDARPVRDADPAAR